MTLDALLRRVQGQIPVAGALIRPKLLRVPSPSTRNPLRDELLKRLGPAVADIMFDTMIMYDHRADDDAAIERQSSVLDWASVAPARRFHVYDDQTMPYVSETQARQALSARGASDVSLTDCTRCHRVTSAVTRPFSHLCSPS